MGAVCAQSGVSTFLSPPPHMFTPLPVWHDLLRRCVSKCAFLQLQQRLLQAQVQAVQNEQANQQNLFDHLRNRSPLNSGDKVSLAAVRY
jgi:hypothetical protein